MLTLSMLVGDEVREYVRIRRARPDVPAATVWRFVRHHSGPEDIDQFQCAHEWGYTGTAYGGDDESYHGEGRCYCLRCGLDGDG